MWRVLLVEDHRFFSEALEILLGRHLSEGRAAPAEFRLAATMGDGLWLAEEEGPFDLAVVDLMLPDGDGTDVVRELKAAHPRTRVAVLSAAPDLSGALSAGADEAIPKCLPLAEILAILARLAEHERAA